MAADRQITLAEVQQHASTNDCWIILEDKVYDVTKFLSEHPGGEEVISELAGKDATSEFADVGHSKDAKEMAQDYLIGTLVKNGETAAAKGKASGDDKARIQKPGSSFKDIMLSPTWTNFVIPTVIGVVVYVLYKGAVRMFN